MSWYYHRCIIRSPNFYPTLGTNYFPFLIAHGNKTIAVLGKPFLLLLISQVCSIMY